MSEAEFMAEVRRYFPAASHYEHADFGQWSWCGAEGVEVVRDNLGHWLIGNAGRSPTLGEAIIASAERAELESGRALDSAIRLERLGLVLRAAAKRETGA